MNHLGRPCLVSALPRTPKNPAKAHNQVGKVQAARSSHGHLRGWVVAHHPLNTALVLRPVLLEQVVGVCLSRRLGIGVVEEILNSDKDLLDSDGWLPSLLLVQYGQADGATRVDIRVEKRWDEFACPPC